MQSALVIALVVVPFVAVFVLLGRVKRNRGSQHGGGLDGYWRNRSGR